MAETVIVARSGRYISKQRLALTQTSSFDGCLHGSRCQRLLYFDDLAAFYERVVDPLTLPIGSYALDLLQVSPSDMLIDVAAGTGALAEAVAQCGVRVLAIDMEPKMVSRATSRLTPYASAEARIARFDALGTPAAMFDFAVSIVGVLAFPGGDAGLRELVRVTRPGGRVAVATWDQEQTATPQYLARDVYAPL